MSVVTRFAPSPTGFLHIGGARTALFNWLFARHHNGRFLLRIEDTDRKRSTQLAIDAILEGLKWLELDWDGVEIYQSQNAERHAAVARELLERGGAYHCYASAEELTEMREVARAKGSARLYDGRWRDRDPSEAPPGVDPVVRLKAPLDGEMVIEDAVQGTVRVAHDQLDDMVLLRADGTPTYMLSVVVDDHDAGITHVIRGDDHLTNAFRQSALYQALGWTVPTFAHIPLIHGADGAKLSKRHGALGVDAYRDMGYLPEALRNYLLRLGWSHGDEEVIATEQAVQWFALDSVGRSPSRLDLAKLEALNGLYIREKADAAVLEVAITEQLSQDPDLELGEVQRDRIRRALPELRPRAKTLIELGRAAKFLVRSRPLPVDDKASKLLGEDGLNTLKGVVAILEKARDWRQETLETEIRSLGESQDLKLGKVAQPIRAALCGSTVSPSLFAVMEILGREETLGRLGDALSGLNPPNKDSAAN